MEDMTPGWILIVGSGVCGCCGGEVVVEKVNGKGVVVRVSAPRHGFRVRAVKWGAKL